MQEKEQVKALEDGELDGLVVQNPFEWDMRQ